jgi:hypothetical protein
MLWWRKVRNHTYWLPGGTLHPEGLSYYVPDVALRRQNQEEGLSLFAVTDQKEWEILSIYYALTLSGYDNLDYLVIPEGVWITLGLHPGHVPYHNLHPFLSDRHYEVIGLTEAQETKLAQIILANPDREAGRARRNDIKKTAQTLLAKDLTLRQLLNSEWENKVAVS